MNNDRDVVDPATFRKWVSSLKRRGCNVLVTGDVREAVSYRTTRKMLGATDVPRTRVLALTDQDHEDVPALLPGDVSAGDEDVRLVDYDSGTRTAAATASTDATATATAGASSDGATPECGRQDLTDLRTDICDAITAAKNAENGFEPAQLRASLFTLSYLVNQYDREAVERFVSAVGDHVRGVSGMAHYHLPVADDSDPVRRLTPLFDVRIELREKHGVPEQRWHFPERDASTSWVGL